MHVNRTITFTLGLALAATAAGTDAGAGARGRSYRPRIDPADFVRVIDNAYHPLVPGTTRKLIERSKEGLKENEITVTHDTKVVMGVTCVVVHDVVRLEGKIEEETYEWFAQDRHGTVWYFGEDTKEYGPGNTVSTEGSWQAGVGKDQPGIIMPAVPRVGLRYRQEYGPGVAEDMAQIVALGDTVSVANGLYRDCVTTKEWSLLEPGTERKWYAKGVGCVRELSAEKEVSELVSLTKP